MPLLLVIASCSEAKSETQNKRPFSRDVRPRIQRTELVVLVGEVQDADADFAHVAAEAVAGERVELPEAVAATGGTRPEFSSSRRLWAKKFASARAKKPRGEL